MLQIQISREENEKLRKRIGTTVGKQIYQFPQVGWATSRQHMLPYKGSQNEDSSI